MKPKAFTEEEVSEMKEWFSMSYRGTVPKSAIGSMTVFMRKMFNKNPDEYGRIQNSVREVIDEKIRRTGL